MSASSFSTKLPVRTLCSGADLFVRVALPAATWIEPDPETGEELVRGFAKIEKARWKLVSLAWHCLPLISGISGVGG